MFVSSPNTYSETVAENPSQYFQFKMNFLLDLRAASQFIYCLNQLSDSRTGRLVNLFLICCPSFRQQVRRNEQTASVLTARSCVTEASCIRTYTLSDTLIQE